MNLNKTIVFLSRVLLSIYNRSVAKDIKSKFKSVGNHFEFDPSSFFGHPDMMEFGDNVFLNKGSHLSGEIKFGNNIMAGPNLTMFSHDHFIGLCGKSIRGVQEYKTNKKITIEDEVWIGSNVTILKGVCIGIGSVIGAASLVNSDVPPFTLVAGVPAKPLRLIFTDEKLFMHLTLIKYCESYARSIIERRSLLTVNMNLSVIGNSVDIEKIQSIAKRII